MDINYKKFEEIFTKWMQHFMNDRAEISALKSAIEKLFGSVINFYIVN